MSISLHVDLHAKQLEVLQHPAKNKVTRAGRRGGKTYLAALLLLINGLEEENREGYDVRLKEVWYVAPTFQQGKDIIWGLIKDMGKDVIDSTIENTATIKLINGRTIKIKGSDRPDTLRGPGLSFVVLDEFADMKPETWEEIVQPALMEVDGAAFFIGTPKGKNHFYELWMMADKMNDEDWAAFHFTSADNPYIPKKALEGKKKTMSAESIRQELEASFDAVGAGTFKESEFQFADRPPEAGQIYLAMDPAGFGDTAGKKKSVLAQMDEHAIAIVETGEWGWFVHDVLHGRWGVREASLQFLKACRTYRPIACGIEKGVLMNAMQPYIQDQSRRLNVFPHVEPLTHGNQRKIDRISWALQGRFQNKRIWFKEDADYVKPLVEQLLDFPNPMAHDDLVDALAYIDQLSHVAYHTDSFAENYFEPLDHVAGY